ncbi:MAG: hypoxanthine phosphoribosyltransferase [Elusimicrobiota bacterium]|jgi:hypoxanthine phosphoribosyltransferase|nr:hypoxanthine phosphoribosyltransferase [Elusimicrobiota bacterium]
MNSHKIKTLITKERIQERIAELSKEIQKDFEGRDPLIVSILKGSFVFCSDLIRHLNPEYKVDFIMVKSYIGTQSSGEVKIISDVKTNIEGKDILIVDDIADTGVTIDFLRKTFLERGASSVKVCVLLDKKDRRVVDTSVEYKCFDIPNYFIVGFGLDYNDLYRGLPFVGILEQI